MFFMVRSIAGLMVFFAGLKRLVVRISVVVILR
jgi:hypothetical protein